MAKKLWIENIENLPAVVYQEESPGEGWLDKTNDPVAWDQYGERILDYIFVLPKIINILLPKANLNYPIIDFTGWGTLTTDEKKVFSKTVVYVPYPLRVPDVFSDEQDIQNAINLLVKTYGIEKDFYNVSLKGRRGIVERMRQHVFLNYVRKGLLSLDVSKDFGKDTVNHLSNFERFSHNDFINWLTNKVGTPFETDGFQQRPYYSEQLKNELLTIYNGEQ